MAILAFALVCLVHAVDAAGADRKSARQKVASQAEAKPLILSEGRALVFERSFSSEKEVRPSRSFWNRVVDFVAGSPILHQMIRPYAVVADSHGRIVVTDPGVPGVHFFDFSRQRYTFVTHGGKDPFRSPQCVAIDAQENVYITDSDGGRIFVFTPEAKFVRVIGSLKGGEGFFKRPTGIVVDSNAQRIYVSDTLRHKIFALDMQGNIVQTIGSRGAGPGQFNFPTELRLHGQELLVVDAMNFRVQVLDRSGQFLYAIGHAGEISGTMFRPKGIGTDSEGNLYVVDALFDTVQVFDREGRLLYYFGQSGNGVEDFQLPAGLFIDRDDRIYVVDSYNRRVQVFRYSGLQRSGQQKTALGDIR